LRDELTSIRIALDKHVHQGGEKSAQAPPALISEVSASRS
jgi:hypothetical protein